MIPIINMNMVLEKELELERQGLRRSRRYIGDGSLLTDSSWYQAQMKRVPQSDQAGNYLHQVTENKPIREMLRSILTHLLRQPRDRRQPTCGEYSG